MKIRYLILFTAALIVVSIALLFFFGENDPSKKNYSSAVEIDGHFFKVEIAKSSEAKIRGLSERKNMCENCGMLFKFEELEIYPFTMRGMEFPLDMFWINGNKIVYISRNTPIDMMRITPDEKADWVLELNAGTADKYGIKIGDEVNF